MLDDLGQLELGRSSVSDSLAKVQEFGVTRVAYAHLAPVGCNAGDEFYSVSIRQNLPYRLIRTMPLVARTGLIRYWQVDGALQFQKGVLVCFGALVFLPQPHDSALFAGLMRVHPSGVSESTQRDYDVSFKTPPDALVVTTYPESNAEQKAIAFRPNLACLSGIRGCKYPCELSPAAWEYLRTTPEWQHLLLGYGKPPDADDPRCMSK